MNLNLSFLIIIANYNGQKYLKKCLDSIYTTEYKDFKVCIVDDGSTDDSLNIINSYTGKLNLDVINQDHGGASKARNKAILKYSKDFDVTVFLDNDTEVNPKWLTEINNFLIQNTDLSGVQCLLIDFENRDKIQSNGIILIPHVCWGISIQTGENLKNLKIDKRYCAAISAGLAVKSEALLKIGLFDEKLAVSTEDLDLTWRLWLFGFRVSNCPKSIVYHYTKKLEERRDMNVNLYSQYFNITKNSIRSLIKNYSFKYLIWFLPQALIINFVRAVLVLLRRGDSSSILAFFAAIGWNIVNLKSSILERSKIQKNRKFSDKYIYNTIMTNSSLKEIYEENFKQTNLL